MHAKPDLRVFLEWMIADSGSVITDVIPLCEINFIAVLLAFAGCGRSNTVESVELTQSMIGKWGRVGDVALTIREIDRRIEISTYNDTWRMEISDAQIVDDAVTFVQKNYLHDGSDHPLNGVAFSCIAKLVNEDTLEIEKKATKDSPEFPTDALTDRLKRIE